MPGNIGPQQPSPNDVLRHAQQRRLDHCIGVVNHLMMTAPQDLAGMPKSSVSDALGYFVSATDDHFANVYDTLRDLIDRNPVACAPYRDAVTNFLRHTEKRRLQIVKPVIDPRQSLEFLRYETAVVQQIAHNPQNVRNRDLAADLQARLEDVRRDLRDDTLPPSPPRTPPVSPTWQTTLPPPVVEDYDTQVHANTHRVSKHFKEGVKVKYMEKRPGAAPRTGRTLFSRLGPPPGEPGRHYTISPTLRDESGRKTQGSYGKIRLAIDDDGVAWAVKELRLVQSTSPHAPDKQRRTRVTAEEDADNEFELMKHIESSQQVRDAFAVDGKVYAVIPLMDSDFYDVIAARDRFSRDDYKHLMRKTFHDVAKDLATCHAKGIMHRDIKDENILLRRDGTICLSDVGLAHWGLESDAADLRGTPGYFAPEVVDAGLPFFDHYDARADIFSLALTMLYMQAPSEYCPFFDYTGRIPDMRLAMAMAKNDYQAWRERVSKDDNPKEIDWKNKVLYDNSPGMNAFAKMAYHADKKMATYIFDHMLQLDPADRHSAQQVHEKAAEFYQKYGIQEQDVLKRLDMAMPELKKKDDAVSRLREHHRKAKAAEARTQAQSFGPPTPPQTPDMVLVDFSASAVKTAPMEAGHIEAVSTPMETEHVEAVSAPVAAGDAVEAASNPVEAGNAPMKTEHVKAVSAPVVAAEAVDTPMQDATLSE